MLPESHTDRLDSVHKDDYYQLNNHEHTEKEVNERVSTCNVLLLLYLLLLSRISLEILNF